MIHLVKDRLTLLLLALIGALSCASGPSVQTPVVASPSAGATGGGASGGADRFELQARSSSKLQLEDFPSIIAARNPAVSAARARWLAARQKRAQETSLPDPRAEGTIFNPKDDEKWMLGLTQELPWPGKLLAAGKIADQQAGIEALAYLAALRDAVADAKESYFELYYIDRAEGATAEIQKLYERYAALAARGQDTGRTKLPELFRAESQRAQLGYDLILLREMRKTQEERLRATLGGWASTEGRTEDADDPTTLTAKLEQLLPLAEANNQELAMAEKGVEKAASERRLARQAPLPDFMIGMRYTEMVDEPGMPVQNPVGFTAGISAPIWFRKYQAKAEEARQMEAGAKSEEEAARLKLRADLTEACFRLNNSFRLVRLYRDTLIPQARQAQQSAEELYSRREANLASLLETLSTVHNFELARLRATADFYQNVSRVERLVGVAVPLGGEAAP